MRTRSVLFAAVFAALGATAMPKAAPAQRRRAAPRRSSPKPKPGDEIVDAYLEQEAERLAAGFLRAVNSAADWQALRPRLHREYLDMLGLWPLPKRTPLKATVTGTLERDAFVVEKLHFQSRPRLYVTANFYRPKKVTKKLPAVLYVCGHAGRGRNGNKTAFQHHGMWFATHGYVCLIIDTLQLGEIAAIHHGTYRYNRWWWHSRGYTPAGVECWNSIRAVDYLQSRGEVDGERIAVTGISGGGACSFWAAAADERIQVAVPVSGMGDLDVYVTDKVVNGHCDCMFLYNAYQWPWTYIAALIAPRALLFANSDHDGIFPMDGNERVIQRLRRLYRLLGKERSQLGCCVSNGGHKDRLELRLAAYRWINKHFKGSDDDVYEPKLERFDLKDLRVFPDKLPADELNTKIDETFVPTAEVKPPADEAALGRLRKKLTAELRGRCFAAWPSQYPKADGPTLAKKADAGTFDAEPPLTVGWRYSPGKGGGEKVRWLVVLNEGESDARLPAWAKEIVGDEPRVLLSPRGVGPTQWTIKRPYRIRRSMALLGRTVDSGRVWDVMAFAGKTSGPAFRAIGRGRAGVIAAYAALFEPRIEAVTVVEPPASHHDGPHFLGVMRVTDIPATLGLLAPRPLTIHGAAAKAFADTAACYRAAAARTRLKIREGK